MFTAGLTVFGIGALLKKVQKYLKPLSMKSRHKQFTILEIETLIEPTSYPQWIFRPPRIHTAGKV